MEMTVYNSQKGGLETIDAHMKDKNTKWFDNCENDQDISMIADFEGGILISEFRYPRPLWIYGMIRAEIGYDQKKAKELKDQYA